MPVVRSLLALSVVALLSACSSPGNSRAHGSSAGMSPMGMHSPGSMANSEAHMKAMQEMRQKMSNATPAERQAMMAEHRSMMQMMTDMMGNQLPPAAPVQ